MRVCIYETIVDKKRYSILEILDTRILMHDEEECWMCDIFAPHEETYLKILKVTGRLRPIDLKEHFADEDCSVIKTSDDFLFFELSPEKLISELLLILHTPYGEHLLELEIIMKKFIPLNKLRYMMNIWETRTIRSIENVGTAQTDILLFNEKLKVNRMVKVLKYIIENAFKYECWEIYQRRTKNVFYLRIEHLNLLQLAHNCFNMIADLLKLFEICAAIPWCPLLQTNPIFLNASPLLNWIPDMESESFQWFHQNFHNFLKTGKFKEFHGGFQLLSKFCNWPPTITITEEINIF